MKTTQWAMAFALGIGLAPAMAQDKAATAWAELIRLSPCDWLPAQVAATIVGPDVKPQARTTKADVSCAWRTARGQPVLTASRVAWTSPAQLVAERDMLLQQIAQYGGNRFERLPSPGGLATIVIRNDRGRVTVFPTGSGSATAITINPHLVLKEGDAEKDARRQRAREFTEALVKQHGL